jgi:carboxylate-amine ligase
MDDVLALTALIQCLVKALSDDIDRGAYQHDCHPMMVRQNKWRACRYGNQAHLVNSFTHEVQTIRQIADHLVERLRGTARELACLEYLEQVRRLANEPGWPQRQREILRDTGDPCEIVRQLTERSRISEYSEETA